MFFQVFKLLCSDKHEFEPGRFEFCAVYEKP